jgi:Tfp pilus assembly protein PilV
MRRYKKRSAIESGSRGRRGLTLVESLISMTLLMVVVLGGLEFFGVSRKIFLKLRDSQDAAERAAAAILRIRLDASEAGKGLSEPMALNVISGVEAASTGVIFRCQELRLALSAGLLAGTEAIDLPDPEGFTAGRTVIVFDGTGGEIRTVRAVGAPARIILNAPVSRDYRAAETFLVLVRATELEWTGAERIVRRKINASPAQPLLEDVSRFECGFSPEANLFMSRFRLVPGPEVVYEIAEFLKNMALSHRYPQS